MKEITGFKIDRRDMSASVNSRAFSVIGDLGAVFSLQVKTSANKYYDFVDRTFEGTAGVHEPNNKLTNVKLQSSTYSGNIIFPADADGETYTFLLWAEPHFDTRHSKSLISRSSDASVTTSYNSVLYQDFLKQVANVTVTFALATDTTDQFASFPSNVTSTQSPLLTSTPVSDIDWTVASHSSDAGGFGIKLSAQPKTGSWYTLETTTVNGAVTSSTTVILDDVDDIVNGMTIAAVSSGSLAAATITDINRDTKEITMSAAQTFADGITLTFRAFGLELIKASKGVSIEPIDMESALVQLTTTVRTDNSGDTSVDVNGTYGISVGATVRGLNIDNSSLNPLTAISPSSTAGTIQFTQNQTVNSGTKLYIDGSGLQGTIKGGVKILQFPRSNTTVYFYLDNIFAQGTGS